MPTLLTMNKVNKCYGFPLWCSKMKFIELWFCFSSVQPHTHEGQTSIIIPLFGWALFSKTDGNNHKCIEISPKRWLKRFVIKAGQCHWFNLQHRPLVFLNISNKPFSASSNFQTI